MNQSVTNYVHELALTYAPNGLINLITKAHTWISDVFARLVFAKIQEETRYAKFRNVGGLLVALISAFVHAGNNNQQPDVYGNGTSDGAISFLSSLANRIMSS